MFVTHVSLLKMAHPRRERLVLRSHTEVFLRLRASAISAKQSPYSEDVGDPLSTYVLSRGGFLSRETIALL